VLHTLARQDGIQGGRGAGDASQITHRRRRTTRRLPVRPYINRLLAIHHLLDTRHLLALLLRRRLRLRLRERASYRK
jgi:hypothetical protein